MLLGEERGGDLPIDLPAGLVDLGDRRDVPERGQHLVSRGARARHWDDCVAVAPLVAGVVEGQRVGGGLQVVHDMPFPDPVTVGVHLHDHVGPHRGVAIRHATWHLGCQLGGHRLDGEIDRPTSVRAPGVMVVVIVMVFPDHLTLGVDLEHDPAPEELPSAEAALLPLVGILAAVEEVAVRQEVAPEAGGVSGLPAVDRIALEVEEVHLALGIDGRITDVARMHLVPVEVEQAGATSAFERVRHFDFLCLVSTARLSGRVGARRQSSKGGRCALPHTMSGSWLPLSLIAATGGLSVAA